MQCKFEDEKLLRVYRIEEEKLGTEKELAASNCENRMNRSEKRLLSSKEADKLYKTGKQEINLYARPFLSRAFLEMPTRTPRAVPAHVRGVRATRTGGQVHRGRGSGRRRIKIEPRL